MTYFARDLMGETIIEPTKKQMRALLTSVSKSEPEHPDVALQHESGWCLSAYRRSMVFENVEDATVEPRHIPEPSVGRMLDLWLALAAGNLSAIERESWISGYA